MSLPRLDVMDSNYTTLHRIADDVVFHVHTASAAFLVWPPSARLLLMVTMLLLLMMPNWLLPLLLLVFDSEWALSFEKSKLVSVITWATSAVPVHRLPCGAASRDAF